MDNNTHHLLIEVSEEYGEVLDSFASATNKTPSEAMQLIVEDGLEECERDFSFMLDLLEDCQALMGKKEPVILH